MTRVLGGAAARAASIEPVPGNLGRFASAAGGGALAGAVSASQEDKASRKEFERATRAVTLAEAQAQQTLAIAKASGDRQKFQAGLEQAKVAFNGAVALANAETARKVADA